MKGSILFTTLNAHERIVARFLVKIMKKDENDASHVKEIIDIIKSVGVPIR